MKYSFNWNTLPHDMSSWTLMVLLINPPCTGLLVNTARKASCQAFCQNVIRTIYCQVSRRTPFRKKEMVPKGHNLGRNYGKMMLWNPDAGEWSGGPRWLRRPNGHVAVANCRGCRRGSVTVSGETGHGVERTSWPQHRSGRCLLKMPV